MTLAALIIGDWGNSNARVWLCDRDGTVLDERRGQGIAVVRSDVRAIAAAFADLTAGWPAHVPALLAGVVGASFGWRDAGYLPCPIAVGAIGSGTVRAPTNERAVWIAPGIRCINAWGEPDTMRGEELKIAGWAATAASADAGHETLIALPGTHCKWARVADGQVSGFHCAISGELFALLRNHSVMIDRAAKDAPDDPDSFAQGVALARAAAHIDLSALLFASRARQATGMMTAAQAPSFVSGIVIGCDVRTALRLSPHTARIAVVASQEIGQRYVDALTHWDKHAALVDGDTAMRAGLIAAARAAGLIAG